MRRRVAAAALFLAAGLAAPGAAWGQETDRELGPRVEEMERRFLQRAGEALGIGQGERRRLGEALRRTREERLEAARRRREVRSELQELARAADPDQQRIARLLDEWGELQAREAEIFRHEQRRLAEFLTPLQRARFLYLRHRFLQAAARRTAEPRAGEQPGADERRRPAPGAARQDAPRRPRRRGRGRR